MPDLKKLIRPHLIDLKPYSSARDEYSGKVGVFLDANENALGSVTKSKFNRYPDPYQWQVKDKLSKISKIIPDQIFLGNGSDEAIDLLIRLFCNPGKDKIIIFPPTYGMYKVAADINDIDVIEIPLNNDFQINLQEVYDQISHGNIKLIFICSPNNPTGNLIKSDDIKDILNKFHGIVIIDEAYTDFSQQESFIHQISKYNNLVVMQTFSKAWGLAALRLGMAFASKEIIYYLNKIKPPYNVNENTQVLALEALDNEEKKNNFVNETIAQKHFLLQQLNQLKIVQKVYPSDANFLLVKFENSAGVFRYLIQHKIIVRDRSNVVLCENSLRITVGTNEENNLLLSKLKDFEFDQ